MAKAKTKVETNTNELEALDDLLQQFKSSEDQVNRMSERLLKDLAETGRDPSLAETQFFTNHLGLNDGTLRVQIGRLRQVQRARLAAGTDSDRTLLVSTLADSRERQSTRGSEIREEIQKLEAELRKLDQDVASLEKRKTDSDFAVSQLQDALLPKFIKDRLKQGRKEITERYSRRVNFLAVEIRFFEAILSGPIDEQEQSRIDYVEMLKRLDRSYVTQIERAKRLSYVPSPAFEAAKPDLQEELASMRTEHEELSQQQNAAMAELDRLRDFYLEEGE